MRDLLEVNMVSLPVLVRLLLISLVVTGTYAAISGWLPYRLPNPLACSTGLDSLGGTIAKALLLYLAVILISAGVGLLALFVLGIPQAAFVAILPTAIVVCGSAVGGISIVRVLNLYYGVPTFLTVGSLYSFGLLVSYGVLNELRLPLPVRVVAGLGACALGVALVPAGASLDSLAFRRRELTFQEALTARGELTVYVPARLPTGYRLHSHILFHLGELYYSLSYIYKDNTVTNRPPFTVNSFTKPSYFNPPLDCGQARPTFHLRQPCSVVARLSNGNDLYGTSRDDTYYELIGSTVVTLDAPHRAHFSVQDIVMIFESLHTMSPRELQDLRPGKQPPHDGTA
jgi:hypothetical protein